jgi:hypothetical protein
MDVCLIKKKISVKGKKTNEQTEQTHSTRKKKQAIYFRGPMIKRCTVRLYETIWVSFFFALKGRCEIRKLLVLPNISNDNQSWCFC